MANRQFAVIILRIAALLVYNMRKANKTNLNERAVRNWVINCYLSDSHIFVVYDSCKILKNDKKNREQYMLTNYSN